MNKRDINQVLALIRREVGQPVALAPAPKDLELGVKTLRSAFRARKRPSLLSLNANPEGCNQYTGPDCAGGSQPSVSQIKSANPDLLSSLLELDNPSDWSINVVNHDKMMTARDGKGDVIGWIGWSVNTNGDFYADVDVKKPYRGDPSVVRSLLRSLRDSPDLKSVKTIKAEAATTEGKRLIGILAKRLGIPYSGVDHSGSDTISTNAARPSSQKKTPWRVTIKLLAPYILEMIPDLTRKQAEGVARSIKRGLDFVLSDSEVATLIEAYGFEPERARLIARTEMARAREDGKIGRLQRGQRLRFKLNEGACPKCVKVAKRLGRRRLYAYQAKGIIPVHPNCYCMWEVVNGKTGRKVVTNEAITLDDLIALERLGSTTVNAFCPTGPGGGIDNSCSSRGESSAGESKADAIQARLDAEEFSVTVDTDSFSAEETVDDAKVLIDTHRSAYQDAVSNLDDLDLNEAERKTVQDALTKAEKDLDSALKKATPKIQKLETLRSKLAELENEEIDYVQPDQDDYPPEPEEPEEPTEPDEDDYDTESEEGAKEYGEAYGEYEDALNNYDIDKEQYEKDYAEWEKTKERMDNDYAKIVEKSERDHERRIEKRDKQIETITDKIDEMGADLERDFQSALDEATGELDTAIYDTVIDYLNRIEPTRNVFCATGEGGGIDPSCSPKGSSSSSSSSKELTVGSQVFFSSYWDGKASVKSGHVVSIDDKGQASIKTEDGYTVKAPSNVTLDREKAQREADEDNSEEIEDDDLFAKWHMFSNPDLKTQKELAEHIKEFPKFEGTIYRGLSLTEDEITQIQKSKKFKQKTPLSSWSTSKKMALEFAVPADKKSQRVLIKGTNIETSRDTVKSLKDTGSDENEVLTLSGSLKVKNVKRDKSGLTIIEVE